VDPDPDHIQVLIGSEELRYDINGKFHRDTVCIPRSTDGPYFLYAND
jgi:hypothetical protein